MKIMRIGLVTFILFILSVLLWFTYTRFCLPTYIMEGDTLTYKNNVYHIKDYWSASEEENLGKTIGIGVPAKRELTDLIWPFWVIEYKNDREHNSLFVRGLMGSGGPYRKVSK